jgi:predicted P-loop ATPase
MRDQLWAEALIAYQRGEPWRLAADDAIEMADLADGHRVSDPWEEPLGHWLATEAQKYRISGVPMSQILFEALGVILSAANKPEQTRASAVLRRHGWEKRKKERGNMWFPPASS